MINDVFKCYSWVAKCVSLFILLCESNYHAQLAKEMLLCGIFMGKRDGRDCTITFIHVMTYMYNSRPCANFYLIFIFLQSLSRCISMNFYEIVYISSLLRSLYRSCNPCTPRPSFLGRDPRYGHQQGLERGIWLAK